MIEEKINLLRQYFFNESEILFAFLFGSRAKEVQGKISDWDIAVYFKPQGFDIEWEEIEQDYPQEDRIWDDLIDILKTDEVDLVVLNRAPVNVASQAISQGIPIIIKDRGMFVDFMLVVKRQAEDYREFVDRFYEISQRSSSLSPEEKERFSQWVRLRNILAHEYLDIKWKRIESFIKNSKKHFVLFLKNVKRFL